MKISLSEVIRSAIELLKPTFPVYRKFYGGFIRKTRSESPRHAKILATKDFVPKRAYSKKEVAGRENSSGSASTKKVRHCEERKQRSNLDRKDCFASLAMTRSHLWDVATILANTFFRECTHRNQKANLSKPHGSTNLLFSKKSPLSGPTYHQISKRRSVSQEQNTLLKSPNPGNVGSKTLKSMKKLFHGCLQGCCGVTE